MTTKFWSTVRMNSVSVAYRLGCTIVSMEDPDGRPFRITVRGFHPTILFVAHAIEGGEQFKGRYLD